MKKTTWKIFSTCFIIIFIAIFAACNVAASDYTMWKGDITRAGNLSEIGPMDSTILWENLYLPEGTSGMYPGVDASPVVANGLVYYSVWGDSKGQVNGIYASDAYTGHEIWSYKSASTRGSFVIEDGVLYTGTLGGTVIALNAMTGEKIWSTDSLASYSYVGLSGAPLLIDGSLYIVATTLNNKVYTSTLYVLNAATGRIIDTESLQSIDEDGDEIGDGGIGKFASAAAKSDGSIIYAAGSGGVVSYSPETKNILWRYDTGARASSDCFVSTPVYNDGKIYFVKTSPKEPGLYCLDESGNKLWNVTSPYFGSSSPAITDDKIIVTSGKGIAVFDKSGKMMAKRDVGNTRFASPVVAGGIAYFGTYNSGTLYAVDITTADCRIVWSYNLPQITNGYFAVIEGTPAISNGILYIGAENCRMYAFGVEPEEPEFVEMKNTVRDGTWSAITKAEVVYEFEKDVDIRAPEISNGGKVIQIGTDEFDTVTVSKRVGNQWLTVDANVDASGKLLIIGDVQDAERMKAVFTGRVLGDANGDSRVNIGDSTLIVYNIAGRASLNNAQLFYGDVNGDNRVNIGDSTAIVYYIAKKVDEHYVRL